MLDDAVIHTLPESLRQAPFTPEQTRLAAREREVELAERIRVQQRMTENLPGHWEFEKELWASCCNTTEIADGEVCPLFGVEEKVAGIWHRHNQTCSDLDGDYRGQNANKVERSFDHYRLANDAELPCRACGNSRLLSPDKRPKYQNLSGQDSNPRRLIKLLRQQSWEPGQPRQSDVATASGGDRVAALERELAIERELAQLRAERAASADSVAASPVSDPGVRSGDEKAPESRVNASYGGSPVLSVYDPSDGPSEPEKAPELPVGIRQRGERFQAYLNRSETATHRWTGIGTFATVEEGVAAREAALEEARRGLVVFGDDEDIREGEES